MSAAAYLFGNAHAVAAWLDAGGGVDARCAEYEDVTLLMAAVYGGQEAMVRMLLQRGASVNLQDSLGATALMNAAIPGHTTVVSFRTVFLSTLRWWYRRATEKALTTTPLQVPTGVQMRVQSAILAARLEVYDQ